jgi:aminomethyltransferase
MVPFAGWSMPVQYVESIVNSHLHTRKAVSLFDVSHMLQLMLHGKDAGDFVEHVTVADTRGLRDNKGTYTVILNESGGIVDDAIVNRISDTRFYVVANAGCADKDLAHLKTQLQAFRNGNHSVEMEVLTSRSLVALQGPLMADVLSKGVSVDLKSLSFMSGVETTVFGVPNCRVTRCGYTGEDGVEISVESGSVVELTKALLKASPDVKLAGLGARDSLRLEASLSLYGNDITEETTPIEAGLAWTISKRRRKEGSFVGAEKVLAELEEKPAMRRIGIVSRGPVARHGSDILDSNGQKIGHVTSGCPSPTLKHNVAMGYITRKMGKVGTKVFLSVRGKEVEASVAKMPFVPLKYYFV